MASCAIAGVKLGGALILVDVDLCERRRRRQHHDQAQCGCKTSNHRDLLNPQSAALLTGKLAECERRLAQPAPDSIAALLVKDDFVLMTANNRPRWRVCPF
jgi:hypothetical protein